MNLADISKYANPTTGLVPLKFNKRYKNVNAGEIAGFIPETALALLSHKEEPCELVDVSKPLPVVENKGSAPKKASTPAK